MRLISLLFLLACAACGGARPHPSEPRFYALLAEDDFAAALRVAEEAKIPAEKRRLAFTLLIAKEKYDEALTVAEDLDLPIEDRRLVFLACFAEGYTEYALELANEIGLPYEDRLLALEPYLRDALASGDPVEARKAADAHGMPRDTRDTLALEAYFSSMLAKECDRAAAIADAFDLGTRRIKEASECRRDESGTLGVLESVCTYGGARLERARLLGEISKRYAHGPPADQPDVTVDGRELFDAHETCEATGAEWRGLYALTMRRHDYGIAVEILQREEFAATLEELHAFVTEAIAGGGGGCKPAFELVLSVDVPSEVVEEAFAFPACAGSSDRDQAAYVEAHRQGQIMPLALQYRHARLAYGVGAKFKITGSEYNAYACALEDGDYRAAIDLSLPGLEAKEQLRMVFEEALKRGDTWFVASHAAVTMRTSPSFADWNGWIEKAYETAFARGDFEGAAMIVSEYGSSADLGPRVRACFDRAFKAKDWRSARVLYDRYSRNKGFMKTPQAFKDKDLERLALAEFRAKHPQRSEKKKSLPKCPEDEDPDDWRPEKCEK